MPDQIERDPEIDEMLDRCSKSLREHCLTFHGSLPGAHPQSRFYRPFSRRHEMFFEVWDDPSVQKILAICHRGWGKTSIFNLGALSQSITFGKYPFIVPISATADSAKLQSENLKLELMGNKYIKAVLGEIKGAKWSTDMWVTAGGTMVFPRGRGQQIRGHLHGNDRVSLLLYDDLEDDESVLSIEQRRKTKDFFFSQSMNTIDRSQNNWRAVVVGTILHEDCLLLDLKDDPTWTVLDFPLCSEEYKSYWPAFMDDKACEGLAAEYEHQGLLDNFAREYLNQAQAKKDAAFSRSYFRYYNEGEVRLKERPHVETFILVDPAKTEKQHNAFTAMVAVSIEFVPSGNKIYIRDVINEHYRPDEIIKGAFDLAEKWNAQIIGYEVTGLNEFISQPFRDEMHRRGKTFELVELKARKGEGEYEVKNKGKSGRVAALIPYYRNGLVHHNDNGCCTVLENQLLSFPRSKYWDVMDATAYLVQMLDFGDRHMTEEYHGEDLDLIAEEERHLDKLMEDHEFEDIDEAALEVT